MENLNVTRNDNTGGINTGQYKRFLQGNTARCSFVVMTKPEKKRAPTDEELKEAQALKLLWDDWSARIKGTPDWKSQADVGHWMGISQAGVGHYLHGRNPLNVKVAAQFAEVIGCAVSDFSPRLAKELEKLAERKAALRQSAVATLPIVGTTATGPDDGYFAQGYPRVWEDSPGTVTFGAGPRSYGLILSHQHKAALPLGVPREVVVCDPDAALDTSEPTSCMLQPKNDNWPLWFFITASDETSVRGFEVGRTSTETTIPRAAIGYIHPVIAILATYDAK